MTKQRAARHTAPATVPPAIRCRARSSSNCSSSSGLPAAAASCLAAASRSCHSRRPTALRRYVAKRATESLQGSATAHREAMLSGEHRDSSSEMATVPAPASRKTVARRAEPSSAANSRAAHSAVTRCSPRSCINWSRCRAAAASPKQSSAWRRASNFTSELVASLSGSPAARSSPPASRVRRQRRQASVRRLQESGGGARVSPNS